MAHIIEMPKFSDEMTVGTLGRWHKSEGDLVRSGETLADIETDKATLELESHFDGILLKQFVAAGAKVPVDSPLCVVGHAGERVDAVGARSPSSTLAEKPEPVAPSAESAAAILSPVIPTGTRLRISPLARKLAKAKGIDPTGLTGSGPRGRILRIDILAAEQRLLSAAPPARPVVESVRVTSVPGARPPDRIVPNSAMRTAIARRLVESKSQIPHFYLAREIDAAPLLALRGKLNATLERESVKLSVNDFILKASAFALLKVPEVNGSWGGDHIRLHHDVHVSFAVAIEDGLITPVIRETDLKSLTAISAETKSLAARAKEKKLAPTEFTGGTFCVTNLGMMGVESFSAIINPPNAGILAVGATVKKAVVQGDQLVIGERMTLTLSCDHRVVDGAVGAKFLSEVTSFLENPLRLLCDPPAR